MEEFDTSLSTNPSLSNTTKHGPPESRAFGVTIKKVTVHSRAEASAKGLSSLEPDEHT